MGSTSVITATNEGSQLIDGGVGHGFADIFYAVTMPPASPRIRLLGTLHPIGVQYGGLIGIGLITAGADGVTDVHSEEQWNINTERGFLLPILTGIFIDTVYWRLPMGQEIKFVLEWP